MKIAFSTISCPDYTAAEVAAAARAHGYDGVELYALAGSRLTPPLLVEQLDDISRELSGIPVVSINSWASLSTADPVARAKQVDLVRSAMESAVALECPMVKVFGGVLPPDEEPAKVIQYIADAVDQLGSRGRELGVRLAVETHDGFCLGESLRTLLDHAREDEHVGALWDVHHPYRMGEPVERTDELIGTRVIHAHVKDAIQVEAGWEFRRLGEGQLPVEAMLSALAGRGYTGYVSVDWEKMWHPDLEGPATVLPQYAEVLRRYVADLRCPEAPGSP